MKILNRQTLQVGKYQRSLPTITISKSGKMIFTKVASDFVSLSPETLIEFILDQNKLYLKKTLDPAGFPVRLDGEKAYISCKELFEALKERIPGDKQIQSIKYELKESTREPIAGFMPYELVQNNYREIKNEAAK